MKRLPEVEGDMQPMELSHVLWACGKLGSAPLGAVERLVPVLIKRCTFAQHPPFSLIGSFATVFCWNVERGVAVQRCELGCVYRFHTHSVLNPAQRMKVCVHPARMVLYLLISVSLHMYVKVGAGPLSNSQIQSPSVQTVCCEYLHSIEGWVS